MEKKAAEPIQPFLKLGAPLDLTADFRWSEERSQFVADVGGADALRLLRDPSVQIEWTLDGSVLSRGHAITAGGGSSQRLWAPSLGELSKRLSDQKEHSLKFRMLKLEPVGSVVELQSATRTVRQMGKALELGATLAEDRGLEVDPASAHAGD